MSQNVVNPYRYVAPSVQQCTGFNVGYGGDFGGDNYLRSCKITASSSITVTTLSCNFQIATGNVVLGLYSDSSGPNVLLGTTLETAVVAGDNNVDLVSSVDIVSGISYWVAGESSELAKFQTDLGQPSGALRYIAFTYNTTLPNPFGSSSSSTSGVQFCFSGS